MAIIYTYPIKSIPAAEDLLIISDVSDSNSTKQIRVDTLPGGAASGVSSVTSVNAAIVVNPQVGPVSLESVAYGGDANIGHVPSGSTGDANLFLNGNAGWTTPPNTTYDLTTTLDTNDGKINLVGSDGTTDTLTISGAGTVSVASDGAGSVTITGSGGGGSSYQAGDGINIDTATTPDTIEVDISTGGGLGFNASGELLTDLTASNISTANTEGTNGQILTSDGAEGATWQTPAVVPGPSAVAYDNQLTLEGSINAGELTYTNQECDYIKFGEFVQLQFKFVVTASVTMPEGDILIANIPFRRTTIPGQGASPASVLITTNTGITSGQDVGPVIGQLGDGIAGDKAVLKGFDNIDTSLLQNATWPASIENTFTLSGTMTYFDTE